MAGLKREMQWVCACRLHPHAGHLQQDSMLLRQVSKEKAKALQHTRFLGDHSAEYWLSPIQSDEKEYGLDGMAAAY